jgi:hypothetical protein
VDPDSQPAWWRRGVVAFSGDSATFDEYHQAWNSLAADGDVYQIGYSFQEQRGNVMPEITSFVSVNEVCMVEMSSSKGKET